MKHQLLAIMCSINRLQYRVFCNTIIRKNESVIELSKQKQRSKLYRISLCIEPLYFVTCSNSFVPKSFYI